ncbi:hypothetical protein [Leptospira stimsonii]|uniref:Uncharacterized protein n=1 Tax=Leptospira stimsonii TaxID=2202203 RepID=A0A396ZFZ9_9LEPT|nr:hypothetical protein [Leptospira stimsonii]RHX92418.1 hypothetical protein DLM75_04310 [Leptospira stimsonii]
MLKFHAEKSLPILFTMGFVLHLINFAHYIRDGKADPGQVMTPIVDIALFAVMLYSAFALIWEYKAFFQTYGFTDKIRRKIGYWYITVYVTASIPGHIYYIYTADGSYFEWFAWWFSPIIMVVYIVMIGFCLSLKPIEKNRN